MLHLPVPRLHCLLFPRPRVRLRHSNPRVRHFASQVFPPQRPARPPSRGEPQTVSAFGTTTGF
jgi:hypothetical protein